MTSGCFQHHCRSLPCDDCILEGTKASIICRLKMQRVSHRWPDRPDSPGRPGCIEGRPSGRPPSMYHQQDPMVPNVPKRAPDYFQARTSLTSLMHIYTADCCAQPAGDLMAPERYTQWGALTEAPSCSGVLQDLLPARDVQPISGGSAWRTSMKKP